MRDVPIHRSLLLHVSGQRSTGSIDVFECTCLHCGAAGNLAGFKHVQLELFRQAGQDLLARLAPDLAAHLLTIFRAHSRQAAPVPAATDVNALANGHDQSSNTAGLQHQALPGGYPDAHLLATPVNAAAGIAAPALDDGSSAAAALLSSEIPSQAELSQVSDVQAQLATADFSDAYTLPLLDGNDRAQPFRSAASFSSAHIPTERPSRPSQLPTDVSLGGNPAGSVASAVPAVSQETTRSSASVRAQAFQMQQQIEQDAKHGHLVVLQPQETVQYSSHMLVMKGSIKLEGCPVNTQLVSGQLYSISIHHQLFLPPPLPLTVSPTSLCCAVVKL